MISYLPRGVPDNGRTSIGCIMPCDRIDSASSFRAPSSMRVRGWYLPARSALSLSVPGGLAGPFAGLPSVSIAVASAPSSASRPRPRPFGFFVAIVSFLLCVSCIGDARLGQQRFFFYPFDQFISKFDVGFRAPRILVVDGAGHAIAGGLGQTPVPGHNGLETL